MYNKLDLHEPDKKEDAIDASGYTGIFNRKKKILKPITEEKFIEFRSKENVVKDIFLRIREIDKDRNGFVTGLEFDDIVKLAAPELEDYDVSQYINPFACAENKILIDYKKFRAHVTQ